MKKFLSTIERNPWPETSMPGDHCSTASRERAKSANFGFFLSGIVVLPSGDQAVNGSLGGGIG